MAFQSLTELDKERILNYVAHYANSTKLSAEELLQYWASAKNKYLYDMFNQQLIIKRPISFEEGWDELYNKVGDLFTNTDFYQFYEDLLAPFQKYRCGDWDSKEWKIWMAVSHLMSIDTLTNNKCGESYHGVEIPLPNGRMVKIQKGCKPMRIIRKIAEGYGIKGFEEFRIAHSLCLNTKLLRGELCLSIHPLDYMTMSDNDEGWSSCMSWMEGGEYHQGTVEMMNSPCVVVAYLSNGEFTFGNSSEEDAGRWNSKKWRCLFIVDRDYIISIKQYPYHNENLVSGAASLLAEAIGWGQNLQSVIYKYRDAWHNGQDIDNGVNVRLRYSTNAMYNDFGSTDHYLIVRPGVRGNIHQDLCYSGLSECMHCGNTCPDDIGVSGHEGELWCLVCDPKFYCCNCDETVYDQPLYDSDGHCYCEWCYSNYVREDSFTNETYHVDDMTPIYLVATNNLQKARVEPCLDNVIYVYDFEEIEWFKYFSSNGPHLDDNGRYFVLPQECSSKGLEIFDICSIDDYMSSENGNN